MDSLVSDFCPLAYIFNIVLVIAFISHFFLFIAGTVPLDGYDAFCLSVPALCTNLDMYIFCWIMW